MSVSKFSKAGFVRELCKDGSRWYYVWCGQASSHDLAYISECLNRIHNEIHNGTIVDTRSYKNTSGTRVVSNTGSVLDLNKHDTVYKFDNGYIVKNEYSCWAYVAA